MGFEVGPSVNMNTDSRNMKSRNINIRHKNTPHASTEIFRIYE